MRAETLLRKLHFQKVLTEDELCAYLKQVKSDGSLPPSEIMLLIEAMKQRIETVSVEDFKAVSTLDGGHHPSAEKAGKIYENNALQVIVSKLAK